MFLRRCCKKYPQPHTYTKVLKVLFAMNKKRNRTLMQRLFVVPLPKKNEKDYWDYNVLTLSKIWSNFSTKFLWQWLLLILSAVHQIQKRTKDNRCSIYHRVLRWQHFQGCFVACVNITKLTQILIIFMYT